MPPFNTDKLTAILSAAQNPVLKKLLEDQIKAKKTLKEATAQMAEIEARLFETIPPALKDVLQPPAPPKTRKPKAVAQDGYLKKPDLQELKQILDRRPDNALNIRQDGFDSKTIKSIVVANPDLFVYEKGAWPKVRYK